MRTKLRLISTVLVLSLIFPILSGIIQPVFAADTPIDLSVVSGSYNASAKTLQLRWTSGSYSSGDIIYHTPSEVRVPITDLTQNTITLNNIKNDIIYDFSIELTDDSGINYSGHIYFLPNITVKAEQVDQQYVDNSGGGRESGVYPAIKLTWKMPLIYNGINSMVEARGADLAQIAPGMDRMNFTFHLRSKRDLANVIVKMDGSGNCTASVAGNSTQVSNVKWDGSDKEYSLYLLGVKDSETQAPTVTDILNGSAVIPNSISAYDSQFVLPHQEIYPGCIYVVTMDTLASDMTGNYVVSKYLAGSTLSPLWGVVNYTYTPIRFQLTKDSLDTIYVRINSVNLADVTMPELKYFVQTSNVPSTDDGNWKDVKEILDFEGEYTITNIEGINPKNTVYYRIVVKSDSVDDRIQSLSMPYVMQEDTTKTPVPRNVRTTQVDLAVPIAEVADRSSDITITWDRPSNWDEIKNQDIYFHFLLSTSQKDLDPNIKYTLEANGKEYGDYAVKYRLVKYVSAKSDQITENSDKTKLVYKLKGYDLFTGDGPGVNNTKAFTISNPDNYPTWLLPNKTYYLQMYTTLPDNKGETSDSDKMSEKSLITSFTTLSESGRDVPIPKHFEWVETKMTPAKTNPASPANAFVRIRFDALNIDWNNYTSRHDDADFIIYDLYMSTKTDPSTFKKIGTTEAAGDVKFTTQVIGSSTWWYAEINKFSGDNVNRFGYSLSPNTTYYFMVKVRLYMKNEDQHYRESVQTVLLPITTPRGEPTTPNDNAKRPVAPVDFAIALDKNGNPMVTGQSVTFEWTVKENAAAYNLISTTGKVASDALESDPEIVEDAIYKSFISAFGDKDDNIDGNSGKLTLDPKANPLPRNLTYDSKTKKCRYTINTWLYPNKIYYFSLRAEVVEANKTKSSVWISIPVTTSLIESPTMLQVINDCELAFYWFDTMPQSTADNYLIKIKASGEADYTQLTKSQYNVVKDGSVYYGRLYKLKANTQYSIQVVRSSDGAYIFNTTKTTRNDYYQIEVKWQGAAIDPYSGFEIAVKTEDDNDYKVLNNDTDLEQYLDKTGDIYPYYIEKSFSNLNTDYYTYSARIKLAEVTLAGGTKEHRPLKPNTKYYVKVRAYKKDPANMEATTRSKYIGPVNTRTEFNQGDYDDNDNNTSIVSKFRDMLSKLEEGIYWDVNKGSSSTLDKIYVKDDKVVNLLEGTGYYSCTIDISQSPAYINSDEIYLAKNILTAMKKFNRSVIIKTKDTEYTIRPDTFDIDSMEEFKKAGTAAGSKDVFLKLNNYQTADIQPKAPDISIAVSKMNIFYAQAVVSRETSGSIKDMIKDRLYNEKTGIVQRKIDVIKNPNNLNIKGDDVSVNKYLNQLLEEVKSELSYYIEDTLNGAGYTSGVLSEKYDISGFNSPLSVKMSYKGSTIANPCVIYGSVGNWQKLTQNLKYDSGYLTFFVTGTGKYAVFAGKDVTSTIGDDSVDKPYIAKLAASYDLTLVFAGAGESFNPKLSVTVKDAILLYELISDSQVDTNKDVKTKAKIHGLDKIINTTNINRNINRQEAAAVIIKLYCQRTGADYERYKASYTKIIKDDARIDDKYAIPVYACLNMGILTLDSGSNFNPTMAVNRGDIAVAFQKMLEA